MERRCNKNCAAFERNNGSATLNLLFLRLLAQGYPNTSRVGTCGVSGANVDVNAPCGVSDTRFLQWQANQLSLNQNPSE